MHAYLTKTNAMSCLGWQQMYFLDTTNCDTERKTMPQVGNQNLTRQATA